MSDKHFTSFHSLTEHGMKLTGTFADLLLALRVCTQFVTKGCAIKGSTRTVQ